MHPQHHGTQQGSVALARPRAGGTAGRFEAARPAPGKKQMTNLGSDASASKSKAAPGSKAEAMEKAAAEWEKRASGKKTKALSSKPAGRSKTQRIVGGAMHRPFPLTRGGGGRRLLSAVPQDDADPCHAVVYACEQYGVSTPVAWALATPCYTAHGPPRRGLPAAGGLANRALCARRRDFAAPAVAVAASAVAVAVVAVASLCVCVCVYVCVTGWAVMEQAAYARAGGAGQLTHRPSACA